MLLTPEMCRAARALLSWNPQQLASAAGLTRTTVHRFETGGAIRLSSAEAMLQALQNAGLEFIPAGAKSMDGGPGLRTIPMAEPEVVAAEDAAEMDKELSAGEWGN
jgi:transcriptional regulator with XRE-family HTH domain